MGRRRALAIAALVAALVLGAWLVLGAGATPGPAADVAAPPPAPPPSAVAGGDALDLDTLPEPVRRLLEATPYPPTSGRLHAGQDDLLQPNRRWETHRPIPDTLSDDPEQVVTWRFSADRWAYTGPDVVHAFLEVRRGGKPIAVELVSATAVREGRAGLEGEREPVDFHRAGLDLAADLPLSRFADHHGVILLEVRFEYAPGRFHEDRLRVFYTPADRIPARLTAAGRDFVRDGSLVVPLGVDVDQAGFYRFDANLYGADGEPVAHAAWKGELAPGAQEIDLEVYGKVLRDAGVPGPYTVDQIRGYRFLDGHYPDRENLLDLPATLTTASHPLEVFTDARHDSPEELALAAMLQGDLESGIGVEPPPVASGAVTEQRPPDDDAEVSLPPAEGAAPRGE